MNAERTISSLRPGEAAYTVAHAAWVSGQHMMLHGAMPIRQEAGGTFTLRLVKYPDGHLAVDLSELRGEGFDSVAAFAGRLVPIQVDSCLTPPQFKYKAFRVFDLPRGEVGYMRPTDARVVNDHMFLNGHTELSPEFSEECSLKVYRKENGAFLVDVSYVGDPDYPADLPRDDSFFPIQVLEAVRDNYLQRAA